MRILKLSTTLLLLTSLGLALAQTNPKPPMKPEIDPVRDQMEITRGAINHMVETLRTTSNSQAGFSHTDYELAAAVFQKKLGESLIRFEADLESKIVQPIGLLLKQYNFIKNATSYNAEARASLLTNIFSQTRELAKTKKPVYDELIFNLLSVIGVDVGDLVYRAPRVRYQEYYRTSFLKGEEVWRGPLYNLDLEYIYDMRYSGVLITSTNHGERRVDESLVFNHQVSLLTKGCFTSSCVIMMSVLYKELIFSVSKMIDKGLDFNFSGSGIVSISSTSGHYDVLQQFVQLATNSASAQSPFSLSPNEVEVVQEIVEKVNAVPFNVEECNDDVRRLVRTIYAGGNANSKHSGFIQLIKNMVVTKSYLPGDLENFDRIEAERQRQGNLMNSSKEERLKLEALTFPDTRRGRREQLENSQKIDDLKRQELEAIKAYQELKRTYNQAVTNAWFKSTSVRRSCLDNLN